MKVLGLDVGGTTIKSGMVDNEGNLTDLRRTPTPTDVSGAQLIAALTELVQSYRLAHQGLSAVGLCVPGTVDSERGIAVYSGTLGWRDLPLAAAVQGYTGVPVKLVHDVTAGGLAELRIGAAKDFSSSVVIAIGTGLAASLILDGKVYRSHSAVGELGHVPTRNQRPCVCGGKGCLEMTCSGGALSRNYEELSGEKLSAEQIIELAEAGDEKAKQLWEEFISELGFAIHFITSLIGPESIVIAGGFGYLGQRITEPLNRYLSGVLTFQTPPLILTSSLEGTSGCIGAGLSAIERFS